MRENRFDPLAVLKNILVFLAITAVVFAWTMLVLLIVSFVALSYIKLRLDTMYIISAVVTACFDAAYLIGKAYKKNSRQANEKSLSFGEKNGKNNTVS